MDAEVFLWGTEVRSVFCQDLMNIINMYDK